MRKKDDSKMVRRGVDSGAAASHKSLYFDKHFPFLHRKQTALLTSPIGTQPLLTASSPAYPIIKAI
ncbi:hypothetical protein FCL47_04765 [Desulfopila sp. IMCC35006]|uniref:hypothetical protein n=1 Tax=Desulfopila sp. IMCC35006 TaxID=2569542 RepID=UPI0010ABCC8A|nr:hypothetical protein [Desulfopila sp. IMCC35006]TKB27455.1 hypothetical protein FCL47_04765 [Desulfopila sp. IMCC35006]